MFPLTIPPLVVVCLQAVLQCYESWAALDLGSKVVPLKSSLVGLKLRECLRGSKLSSQVRCPSELRLVCSILQPARGSGLPPCCSLATAPSCCR